MEPRYVKSTIHSLVWPLYAEGQEKEYDDYFAENPTNDRPPTFWGGKGGWQLGAGGFVGDKTVSREPRG